PPQREPLGVSRPRRAMTCPDDNLVVEFLAGNLAPDAVAALEAHVDGCPSCQALVAHLARTSLPRVLADGERGRDPELAATEPDPAAAAPPTTGGILPRGASVGRYVIIEPLGAGQMGVVYAAVDPQLDRKIALKLVRPRDASAGSPDDGDSDGDDASDGSGN